MNESQTRLDKIDPRLKEVGWDSVPGSAILTEQRAYIAPGRIVKGAKPHPKKADYILEYRGKKLAVIEAKSDEKDVSEGVEQAKLYADMLQIRYTYATNGDSIWFIDMGVKNAKGEYIIPSEEHEADRFPTPQELWQMTFPSPSTWRDRFNDCAINRGGGRTPRYYQEIAINNVLAAVARSQSRILLTMATGTGKTYTAFQICWKLTQARWNTAGADRQPRILFIADRNILANQATNDFDQFPEDAICRITPKTLRENGYRVPTARNIYFTIFQTMMTSPKQQQSDEQGKPAAAGQTDQPYYMQYPRNFFDFIIIDECHRGGANDESEWRRLMEYFDAAYQLGMTATPRRRVNANTYAYFGDPVYTYSLRQGIDDGFLVPYRVDVATSNIDTYRFEAGDTVTHGEIDRDREYTENDFYHGNIKIRERDEHRVEELLAKIDPDEKTIVFCASQQHAMIIRDLINKHKRRPASNYCERVTADDGKDGEDTLRAFQDNEKLLPTILTTSHKLSTGVDARNVRNIVLMRPIENMVEFKQIIGRGTRLFDGKYYFTIYDFVGASEMFHDEEWDGDPFCPVCGNYPCTCNKGTGGNGTGGKGNGGGETTGGDKPQPCPICGHLPCTCPGGNGHTVEVKLSTLRKITLHTEWKQLVAYGDEMITLAEFVKKIFGRIPELFGGADDLRDRWAHPDTRDRLLEMLAEAGFEEQKLDMVKSMLKMDRCDLLDVLEYIAYESTPMEREARVRLVQQQYVATLQAELQAFDNLILDYYAREGFKQLGSDKLKTFISIMYNSMADAKSQLGMTAQELRQHFILLQEHLYKVKFEPHYHIDGPYIEKQYINPKS